MVNVTDKEEFIKNEGIYYPEIFKEIGKSDNYLQPIFEAYTNSLEAFPEINDNSHYIKIQLYHRKTLVQDKLDFEKIVIVTLIGT